MMKIQISTGLLLITVLAGCSPHPASGKWHSHSRKQLDIAMIDVMFDGKAQMYAADLKRVVRRCFWAAQDKQTIALQCVKPEQNQTDIHYRLRISGQQAVLMQENEPLIQLSKQ